MRENEEKKLSDAELKVMAVIWDSDESLDLMGVLKRANERFQMQWKPQTVSTFLVKCRKKGYLSSERKGRHFYYTPKVSKEEYFLKLLQEYCYVLNIPNETLIAEAERIFSEQ